ncbi:MAG: PEP-CTERM sorting domain-containing protein, partial [Planctomycetes bacterium]|nr:PEP-CTERM sorting domain-containing protein [Planctomycetota bacterium]
NTTRDMPTGTANQMYAYFPRAGLYPLEFYSFEATGGSGIEIAHGGQTSLLVSSRNPTGSGFTVDWGGVGFAVTPVAMLRANSTLLEAKIFGQVPALFGQTLRAGVGPGELGYQDGTIAPESWTLMKPPVVTRLPGIFGTLYNTSALGGGGTGGGGQGWIDVENQPVLATRVFSGAGNFDLGTSFGFPGMPTDYIAAKYTGYLRVPTTGTYNFERQTDDRSWIFIDIDGDYDTLGADGYRVFEAGEYPAGNDAWTVNWNGVNLTAGDHRIEMRAREWGGGEWTWANWSGPGFGAQRIPLSALYYDDFYQEIIASGVLAVGDLDEWATLMEFPMSWEQTYGFVLRVDIAGLTAVYELNDVLFIPEPSTLVVLAGGLLAAAAARRRRSRTT